ncbi:hypothetical protein Nepgr_023924 [Nepenthes gracilis]|uniref:Uncharacterized protein n=1 Tax=Nepenthes gracilis TaxID=150966 RepID=A0AAD3XZY6_NEPGR|nr:hypothetical protein Nepgr_023924 [Nepenthes gracilis]
MIASKPSHVKSHQQEKYIRSCAIAAKSLILPFMIAQHQARTAAKERLASSAPMITIIGGIELFFHITSASSTSDAALQQEEVAYKPFHPQQDQISLPS